MRAGQTFDSRLGELVPRVEPERRTRLLGILNLTPDSFHDGGVDASVAEAVERARRMVDEGADALDLGGASSRPGSGGGWLGSSGSVAGS